MSGFAAIYNLDGRPANRALVGAMLEAIAYRGPDSRNCWTNGPVALGHAMLCTTPESIGEKQPLIDEDAGLAIVLDGRVDNRDEVKRLLQQDGLRFQSETDAEIFLRAYQCWGEESPARIIGDFAFVIWDAPRQQLFCARDFAAVKPFYYCFNARKFLCGSELQQILVDETVRRKSNQEMIAFYLAGSIVDNRATLYQAINRLEPGHALVVTQDKVRVSRFFDIDPRKEIRYRRDDQYAEHFREVFAEAVRCRMRSPSGVAAQLSGGIDSSFIVGTARRLIARGRAPDPPLETFSLVFSHPDCDERQFIDDVVEKCRVPSHRIDPFVPDLQFWSESVRHYRDFVGHPNGVMSCSLAKAVREQQFRVLLTGHGGDQFFAGSQAYMADLLVKGRLLKLLRVLIETERVRQHDGGASRSGYLRSLFRFALWPTLPVRWKIFLRHKYGIKTVPEFVSEGLNRRFDMERRILRQSDYTKGASFAQTGIYKSLVNGFDVHCMELIDRDFARSGIEGRQPFYDRRVIEFAFAIPEEQRCKEGWNRYIVRRAGAGLLPESVRTRRDKAEFSSVFMASFEAIGGTRALECPELAARGLVDPKKFRLFCEERLKDRNFLWLIWATLEMELWLRESAQDNSDVHTLTAQPTQISTAPS